MECIFGDYIKFVDNFLTNYYKLLLDGKYDKNIVKPFIDKYIDVRYYNKYSINEDNFTERLNKELNNVVADLMKEHENKKEMIKNVFALFSYVLFIDGCTRFNDINVLLKTLYNDKNISLKYTTEIKKNVSASVKTYITKKIDFFKVFETNEFYLKGKKIDKNIYHVDLGQNCNLSKLYSDYAIEKAYDSVVVMENRAFLTVIMLSSKILSEVIALDFTNDYVIDFPATLFEKTKKIMRFLRALDDELLKEKISLKIYYKDYKKYKRYINSLISAGYSISLELDDTYTTNFDNLFLFSNILVSKKYDYYDIIIDNKDIIKTNIITV